MLIISNLVKDYEIKDNQPVHALKNITLEFPDTGFVSILGPSGCGKTTLLNIIGGLDQYTSGDLIINGESTKNYKDQDWDNYRNREVGIVFQSYNLIPHLSVKGNVELAMTLSGVKSSERSKRAAEALEMVGLKEQINKRPNQLSGGQMQRVALARALVNKPSILLADEPTGALDSATSIQVMDILKDISKTRLVIIVTHNETLADKYSDRIIRLSDGEVISDSFMDLQAEREKVNEDILRIEGEKNASEPVEKKKPSLWQRFKGLFHRKKKNTSMSYLTALGISGRNLLSKKGKTIITSIAASFGIIGVGLVLALSNGFTNYVDRMEVESLSLFPMTIEKYGYNSVDTSGSDYEDYPDDGIIHAIEPSYSYLHTNNITTDFIEYLSHINDEEELAEIRYDYSIGMNVISRNESSSDGYIYTALSTSSESYVQELASSILGDSSSWSELPASSELILDQYDVLAGTYPDESQNLDTDEDGMPDQDTFDLVLVVDSNNTISTSTMAALGLDSTERDYTLDDLLGLTFKYVPMDQYYSDPIPKSITDDDGNTTPVTTTGFFFKDSVTINDINDVFNDIILSESDFELSGLFDLFDLPDIDTLMDALSDVEVLQALSPVLNSEYLDLDALSEIWSNIESGESMTIEDLTSLFEPMLGDEDKQAIFGDAIEDALSVLAEDEEFSSYFTRQLYYYESPSSDQTKLAALYNSDETRTLRVSCILREKEETSLGLLSSGVYYPKTLTYQAFYDNSVSSIAQEFKDHILFEIDSSLDASSAIVDMLESLSSDDDIWSDVVSDLFSSFSLSTYNIIGDANALSTSSSSFSDYMDIRLELGSDFDPSEVIASGDHVDFLDPMIYADFVTTVTIYPADYDAKQEIIEYLTAWNSDKDEDDHILYTDVGQMATDIVGEIVSVISTVLIAFASISLIVSSIMIAILIYSSVVERTKEIGILRSIGARKRDVSRLFKAEAVIIGLLSGIIGVALTYLFSLLITFILNNVFSDVALGQICFLNPVHGVILILISAVLTYIASLIPSRIAARKNPVTCLRTE